jgi:hypothetical protein
MRQHQRRGGGIDDRLVTAFFFIRAAPRGNSRAPSPSFCSPTIGPPLNRSSAAPGHAWCRTDALGDKKYPASAPGGGRGMGRGHAWRVSYPRAIAVRASARSRALRGGCDRCGHSPTSGGLRPDSIEEEDVADDAAIFARRHVVAPLTGQRDTEARVRISAAWRVHPLVYFPLRPSKRCLARSSACFSMRS